MLDTYFTGMMKIWILCMLSVFLPFVAGAQTQSGLAKTKGRLNSDGTVTPGRVLDGVTVKVKGRTAVLSNEKGAFTFPVPAQKFSLETVRKGGYELVDPEVLSRQYAYSAENPLILVLETPAQQADDALANERRIRRNLQRQLMQREDEIEQLREENRITQEEYRTRLQELYAQQETSDKLISKMVEYYSRIDYDQLDDYNRRISTYILNGELARADSLLSTKGNLHARIAALQRHQSANADERAALAKRQENLEQSEAYARKELEDLAQDCLHKHEIYKMQAMHDSAGYYIGMRAELDTMNVAWQIEAARFLSDYQSDYDRAQALVQRVLRHAVEQEGKNSVEIGNCYYCWSAINVSKGIYQTALEQCRKALDIWEEVSGKEHEEVVKGLNLLGRIYASLADYDHSLKSYREALDIQKKISGMEHTNIVGTLKGIASVYRRRGLYRQALEYGCQALEIGKCIYANDSREIADLYHIIGVVYAHLGDCDEALKYYRQTLEITRRLLGENHVDYAGTLQGMGNICLMQGDRVHALEYYQQALQIQQNIFGACHPNVAGLLVNIGLIYADAFKDYARALDYFRQALQIQRSIYGDIHPNIAGALNNIAGTYSLAGDPDKALETYRQSLRIYRTVFGEIHPDVAVILDNMGLALLKKGDKEQALEYQLQALRIYEKLESPQAVLNVMTEVAVNYSELGHTEKALEYARRALEQAKALEGENSDLAKRSYGVCYEVYASAGRKSDRYEKEFRLFMSGLVFVTDFTEADSLAVQKGLKGEYVLLETETGCILDDPGDLLEEEFPESGEKEKYVVLMQDGVIVRYDLEDVALVLKYVGPEEKQRICEAYRKWKVVN